MLARDRLATTVLSGSIPAIHRYLEYNIQETAICVSRYVYVEFRSLMQTTGGLHQADAPPHQDLRISRELNAEKPDMPLTSSGLSYAEHMLHDTMQMTRRSAAAAGATLSRDITQSSRWHECSVAKANSTRAKSPPVSPCMLSATSKTRPARDTAMPWATTTLPKPFALAVDQRARSPRIAAHQPQQARPTADPLTCL